ncbi:oocyte zinc finger protein XlCOF6 [Amyelois transitella]|uniref:oocyte zinc finger protein XlCOF6 n=1 Tax=Amyelois transitella TaxID=680683 RepID=UPI002990270E|nr:oocyte zinc finger protein XlCOF6 [Amyelois transitella]
MWSGDQIYNDVPVICRGCLATDVKLFNIRENNLAEAYVHLIGDSLHDHFPKHLCVFCRALLTKFLSFREKCLRSQGLFVDAEYQGRCITPDTLREISQWNYKPIFTIISDAGEYVETPIEEKVDIHLKQEEIPALPDGILYFKEDKTEEKADSDDDDEDLVPLEIFINDCIDVDSPEVSKKRIKKSEKQLKVNTRKRSKIVEEKDVGIKSKKRKIKVKKERKPKTSKSADEIKKIANAQEFDVIFLTRDEQLEEIEERKKAALKLKNSIKCKFCGKNFQTQDRLDAHFKFYHDSSVGHLVCEFCQCRFNARHKFSHHLRIHLVRFCCRNCGFTTKRDSTLKRHYEWHQGKRHMCTYCDKDFAKISSYLSHVRLIHAAELPWCELCGESFIGEKGVQAHKKLSHKGVDASKFVCNSCKTSFIDENALDRHTAQKRCDLANCVQCGDAFASQQLLKYHLVQRHRAEGSLTNCDGCGVRFHNTSAHQRHLPACGARAVCVQCGRHYGDERQLKLHEAEDHTSTDLFKCEECNKTFSNAYYFREHCSAHLKNKDGDPRKKSRRGARPVDPSLRKWRVVGEEAADVVMEREAPKRTLAKKGAMCEVCGKSFQNAGLLKYHQRIHSGERPYHCSQCSKSFTTNRLLEEHIRVHTGERPYKCGNCPKAFKTLAALNRHNLVHNGLRRHVCQLCDKTFQTSSCAKVHIKTVHMKLPTPPRVRRRRVKDE